MRNFNLKTLLATIAALVLAGCGGGPEPSACDSDWVINGIWSDFQDRMVNNNMAIRDYDDMTLRMANVKELRAGDTDMRCSVAFDITRNFDSRDNKDLSLPGIRYSVYQKQNGEWFYRVTRW